MADADKREVVETFEELLARSRTGEFMSAVILTTVMTSAQGETDGLPSVDHEVFYAGATDRHRLGIIGAMNVAVHELVRDAIKEAEEGT